MTRPFIIAVSLADPQLADPARAAAMLAQAEDSGIDLAMLGSPLAAPFDPLVLAAWLAPRTQRIGLVASVPAPLSHPFHVARALSAIDFLSAGRAGWQPLPQSAPNGMAEDMVAAACSLWDGWDAEALIIDKASGRYLDTNKVRASHYSGPFFKVAGPVNAMRPPQGHPLLVRDCRDGFTGPVDVGLVASTRDSAAARSLLRSDPAADPAIIARRFTAGEIDGIHFDLVDPADFAIIAARFGAIAPRPATTGTLRHRLALDLPARAGEPA